jgi:hypothetical protein
VSRDVSFEEEMVSSPPHPSIVQREPVEPMETFEPVDPVDVPRDIAVGQQRLVWAHQTLQKAERYALLVVLSEKVRDLRVSRAMLQP